MRDDLVDEVSHCVSNEAYSAFMSSTERKGPSVRGVGVSSGEVLWSERGGAGLWLRPRERDGMVVHSSSDIADGEFVAIKYEIE